MGTDRLRTLGAMIVLLAGLAGNKGSGFLLDDCLHLERLATTTGIEGLDYVIDLDRLDLHLVAGPDSVTIRYFRPLTSLSLQIDYRLFGARPFVFHLVNLLLHLANVWLVLVLGRRLGLAPTPALVAALMWGVSLPAGLAAGWISARSELLAALFVLGSLVAALRFRDSRSLGWLLSASLLVALAGLAKESALVGPALVMIALGAFPRRSPPDEPGLEARVVLPVAMWGTVGVLLALRLWLVGLPQLPPPYAQPPTSLAAAGAMLSKAGVYLAGGLSGLPVLPFVHLAFLREHHFIALLLAALLAGVVWIFMRTVSAPGPFPALRLWAWFFVALAPALWVMSVSLYLYLPLIGLAWLFGFAWQRSRIIRLWLGWLVVVGLVGNVAFSACMVQLGQRVAAAQAVLDDLLAAGRVEDVILVDAPFWAYALPSRARLDDPSRCFRTHILNFSPYLQPASGSSVRWHGRRELELTTPGGHFFASPLERFFLFGNDPGREAMNTRAFSVTCRGGDAGQPHPSSLDLVFDPSLPDSHVAILQFDRWRARRLILPADPGPTIPESE